MQLPLVGHCFRCTVAYTWVKEELHIEGLSAHQSSARHSCTILKVEKQPVYASFPNRECGKTRIGMCRAENAFFLQTEGTS